MKKQQSIVKEKRVKVEDYDIKNMSIEQLREFLCSHFHKIPHTESFEILVNRLEISEKEIKRLQIRGLATVIDEQALCRYITKAIADKRILVDNVVVADNKIERERINKELKKLDKRLRTNEDLMGKTKGQRIRDTLNKLSHERLNKER